MTHSPSATPVPPGTGRDRPALLALGPAVAGALVAVLTAVAVGTTGGTAQPVVVASALVYVGAAAVGRPMAAWPVFGVTFVVIGIGYVVPGWDPTLAMIALGALLAVYGLVRGRSRPAYGLPLQIAAFLVFMAVALVAARVTPTAAGVLVAGALLAHAGWDLWHHRTRRVVARSLAEFCLVLDTLLAALVLWLTFSSP